MTQNSWNSEDPVQVAKGGIGKAATTVYAVQCGGTTTTGPLQDIASVGTAGQILTSNGAGALPTFETLSVNGQIIQEIRSSTVATQTITGNIPVDDTIPQITEGGEVLTAAITPTNASNILKIEIIAQIGVGAGNNPFIGIWQDATADCLAGSWSYTTAANQKRCIPFRYFMVAGTVSSTTFRFRAGLESGSIYINSLAAGRQYGGTLFTSLTVQEIQV